MTMLITICIVLTCVIVYQGALNYMMQRDHQTHIAEISEQHRKERKELLDRIQAPSFAEYKAGEAKVIRAGKDEPPKQTVELL